MYQRVRTDVVILIFSASQSISKRRFFQIISHFHGKPRQKKSRWAQF